MEQYYSGNKYPKFLKIDSKEQSLYLSWDKQHLIMASMGHYEMFAQSY